MLKLTVSRTVKRIFKWSKWLQDCRNYRRARSLSDHRATNLAVRLTVTGALAAPRIVPSRLKFN
jgi:hypothetical protein